MNILEQLKEFTKVVADTADVDDIKKYNTVDATTNPSIIYSEILNEKYKDILANAIDYAKTKSRNKKEQLVLALDKIIIDCGVEILKVVPGRVSTETDARLSFDTKGTIKKARELIQLYESAGISRDRILIKIASTWEGIRAAKVLTKEGIHCNLTLLFSFPQAIACAEAGVQLISPFVGRILDWYNKYKQILEIKPSEEPGVLLVIEIYNYYKKFGYKTEIMGASFRNTGEIVELAGCDLLTITPKLLQELEQDNKYIDRKLSPPANIISPKGKAKMNEANFRWSMNENSMATEKLADGIRKFTSDIIKLEIIINKEL